MMKQKLFRKMPKIFVPIAGRSFKRSCCLRSCLQTAAHLDVLVVDGSVRWNLPMMSETDLPALIMRASDLLGDQINRPWLRLASRAISALRQRGLQLKSIAAWMGPHSGNH